MSKDRKAILVFYGITLALSFIVECLYIKSENELLMVLLMWIPGIVGLICSKVFYGREGSVGIRRKAELRYLLFGVLAPVVYLVCSYCIAWAVLGDPTTGVNSEILIRFAVAFLPGLLGSALTAAGEEIGWRGFAYPVMEREFGAVRAVLINGFIWALWHVPLIVGGAYQAEVNPVYGIISFIVMIMLITVLFCRTRSVSGSVIPAILLHSSHNLVDQLYLQPLSTDPRVPYLAGEQGIITMIITAVMVAGVVRWWRKDGCSGGHLS